MTEIIYFPGIRVARPEPNAPGPRTKQEAVCHCFLEIGISCSDFFADKFLEALEASGWAIARRVESKTVRFTDDGDDCA